MSAASLLRCVTAMSAGPSVENDLLRALGHPLRLRIATAITERGEASPVGLAREFDVPLATVSHHTRVLRDLGWIELVRTEPRRGAVEHFYRAVIRPFIDDEQWERLPLPLRRGLAAQTLREIFARASQAGGDGAFDDAGACVARMPLELDERGWEDLSQLLVEVLREADAIQRRSDLRVSGRSGGGGDVRSSSLAILHHRVTPLPSAGERLPRKPFARPQLP
jgi:DNA-binding transcriptional ArsR family regulator